MELSPIGDFAPHCFFLTLFCFPPILGHYRIVHVVRCGLNFRILGTWRSWCSPTLPFCLLFCFSPSPLTSSHLLPLCRWWPPGDIDAFCSAAGPAEADVVPVAEARWPRSAQHPQPGRSDTCQLGLAAGLSQVAQAPDRVSARTPSSSLPTDPTPDS